MESPTPRRAGHGMGAALLALLVVLPWGCKEETRLLSSADAARSGAPRAPAPTPAADGEGPRAPRDTEAEQARARVLRCFGDLVDEYEAVREALAKADLTRAKRASSRLASSSKTMADACGGPLERTLGRLARDGTAFGAAPNLARAREIFGGISRGMLEVARSRPAFAEGLRAYECPMLEGYGRWLQREGEPTNPYLTPEAPPCAEPVELGP